VCALCVRSLSHLADVHIHSVAGMSAALLAVMGSSWFVTS